MSKSALVASVALYSVALLGCQGQSNQNHDHSHPDHDHGGTAAGAQATPAAARALPIGNTHPGYCQVQGDELDVAEATADPNLHSDFEGKRYLFCCEDCKPLFDADPKEYLANPPPAKKKAAGR